MSTNESRIDFNTMGAIEVHNRCRAFSGWPGVWSLFSVGDNGENIRIKICTTKVLHEEVPIGNRNTPVDKCIEFVTIDRKGMFKVKCFDGSELGNFFKISS